MQDSIYNFENGHILQDFMFDSNDFSRGSSIEREEEDDNSDMGVLLLEPFRLEFTSANPSLRSMEEEEEEWTATASDRVARISSVEIEKHSDTEFAASNPATSCHTVEMDLLTLVNLDDDGVAAAAAAAAGQEAVVDGEEDVVVAAKMRVDDASEAAYSPAESTSSEWTPLQSFTVDPHKSTHAAAALSIYTTAPLLSASQFATCIESPSSESTPTEPTASTKPLKQQQQRRPQQQQQQQQQRLSPSLSSYSTTTDTRPREHECSVCHNRFLRRQDLSRHLVTHSKTKSFPCLYGCGSSFGRSDALARHMKTGKCSKAAGRRVVSAGQ
ncbi:hypothetical protein HDU81_002983 [Chytriomyces hyalinus]|nr:hypothetical protein HDU81_002983 [Chytriomyces hyalinus]